MIISLRVLASWLCCVVVMNPWGSALASAYCLSPLTDPNLGRPQIYRDAAVSVDSTFQSVSAEDPELGVTVSIAGQTLSVSGPDVSVDFVHAMVSGDEWEGWIALWSLGDGWFYARGAEYDTALKLEETDGDWRLASNISIRREEPSFFNSFVRWAFHLDGDELERHHALTAVVHTASYAHHSPALKSVLFLENHHQLVGGRFESIEGDQMARYFGDITTAGTALLAGKDGKLFSYDGHTLEKLDGPVISLIGWSNRPIESDRTFVGGGARLYEVRGEKHGNLSLIELTPTDRSDIGWFYAVTMPGGELLIVSRHGIYRPVGDRLEPVWSPDPGRHIYGPASANRLTDVGLVVTTDNSASDSQDWILGKCR